MKFAVVTLTKGALKKAKEIKNKFPEIDIYTQEKFYDKESYTIKGKFADFVGKIFYKYETILFIMATGIVVRVLSKYLNHKAKDPAILVMDERGKFVISLLSGHLGGANDAAKFIAKEIKAQPVITTASDVKESIAVDTIAMKLNCEIDDLNDAKDVTALIVNDEIVEIDSDVNIDLKLPENVVIKEDNHIHAKGCIYITNKKIEDKKIPSVQLIPKNIVIGVGCRKGVEKERIIDAINHIFDELSLHKKSMKQMATVDVKKEEVGIIETSKYFHVPLMIINREDIKKVEDRFKTSDFVKKTIGVGAVCEPCAYLSSKNGRFILKKTSFGGITLSIWEETNYE